MNLFHNQSTIHLSCGNFSQVGDPPPSLGWTRLWKDRKKYGLFSILGPFWSCVQSGKFSFGEETKVSIETAEIFNILKYTQGTRTLQSYWQMNCPSQLRRCSLVVKWFIHLGGTLPQGTNYLFDANKIGWVDRIGRYLIIQMEFSILCDVFESQRSWIPVD